MTQKTGETKLQTACLLIMAAISVAIALYLLRPVMIPFIIAAFFAFSLTPIINFIVDKTRVPYVVSVIGVLILSFGVIFIFSSLIIKSTSQFAKNADAYQGVIETNVIKAVESFETKYLNGPRTGSDTDSPEIDPASDKTTEPSPPAGDEISLVNALKNEVNILIQKGVVQKSVLKLSRVLADLLKQGLLIFIFVLFLLLGSRKRTKTVGGAWKEGEQKIRSFLYKKIILSGITGILVGFTLKLIGIEFALFFGFLTFALNFIPSIGSIIATIIPLPMVFLHNDFSFSIVIMVLLIPGSIQFLIGNIIEPKIMGDVLDLHPVVILMALIFWGMIWGIVGMLLATPMTAILKILMERNEMTKVVADIMAGRLEKLQSD